MIYHQKLISATFCAAGVLLCPLLHGNAPDWWLVRGVLTSNPADDYAIANIGQLKHMATAAAAELNAFLPGGAGTEVNSLVSSWTQPPTPGVVRDDFAAVNLGQLKAVATPFYDRLIAVGYATQYPWFGGTPDDFAIANLGQLKAVFAIFTDLDDYDDDALLDSWEFLHFGHLYWTADNDYVGEGVTLKQAHDLGLDPKLSDGDNDGLPDAWQIRYFADLDEVGDVWYWTEQNRDAAADPDGDELTNAQEQLADTLPLDPDTDDDQMPDGWEVEFDLKPLDDGSWDEWH